MEIDERFGGHIPIKMIWEVHIKRRLLFDAEAAHLSSCERCLVALVICRISKTLEEAETRFKDHLAPE
jgi:hypothetical protein